MARSKPVNRPFSKASNSVFLFLFAPFIYWANSVARIVDRISCETDDRIASEKTASAKPQKLQLTPSGYWFFDRL